MTNKIQKKKIQNEVKATIAELISIAENQAIELHGSENEHIEEVRSDLIEVVIKLESIIRRINKDVADEKNKVSEMKFKKVGV